jgi:23S rRNA (uracil1939-C5)-methyltransferase
VQRVVALIDRGPVLDLYAGVGLFGLALAASGRAPVLLVEGDPLGGVGLAENAEPFADRARVYRTSVEAFVARGADVETAVVDPPRTGMSRAGIAGLIAIKPSRIVYVSCDVATLARDARTLVDAGYELRHVSGLDLFPNTAHVETVGVFGWEGDGNREIGDRS